MPQVEVSLSKQIDSEIDRLVEEGEFVSRGQAVEDLLLKGTLVYDTAAESPADLSEDVFTQTIRDQQDPAIQDDQQNGEHTF